MGFFEVFAAALSGFYALIPSYGLAIILLTIAVRVVLLPLSIKQTKSMREMQRIQPELKKLQQKYKGDRQKLNEEMMALYKEHGVNPFGGCLPILLQFPVLIALFYVIRTPLRYMGFAPREPDLTAIKDFEPQSATGIMETIQDSSLANDLLSRALDIHNFLGLRLDCFPSNAISSTGSDTIPDVACGSGILSALPYLVLVLLMGFTTWYQQKQMQSRQGASEQPAQMQMIGRIMPIMLMIFAYNFPTGVVLYWLTTNVWTIGQQQLMLRVAPPLPVGTGAAAQARPAVANGNPGATESKPHPSSKKKRKKR
jgi:YidC/Oxa1 family membrane protein insertase